MSVFGKQRTVKWFTCNVGAQPGPNGCMKCVTDAVNGTIVGEVGNEENRELNDNLKWRNRFRVADSEFLVQSPTATLSWKARAVVHGCLVKVAGSGRDRALLVGVDRGFRNLWVNGYKLASGEKVETTSPVVLVPENAALLSVSGFSQGKNVTGVTGNFFVSNPLGAKRQLQGGDTEPLDEGRRDLGVAPVREIEFPLASKEPFKNMSFTSKNFVTSSLQDPCFNFKNEAARFLRAQPRHSDAAADDIQKVTFSAFYVPLLHQANGPSDPHGLSIRAALRKWIGEETFDSWTANIAKGENFGEAMLNVGKNLDENIEGYISDDLQKKAIEPLNAVEIVIEFQETAARWAKLTGRMESSAKEWLVMAGFPEETIIPEVEKATVRFTTCIVPRCYALFGSASDGFDGVKIEGVGNDLRIFGLQQDLEDPNKVRFVAARLLGGKRDAWLLVNPWYLSDAFEVPKKTELHAWLTDKFLAPGEGRPASAHAAPDPLLRWEGEKTVSFWTLDKDQRRQILDLASRFHEIKKEVETKDGLARNDEHNKRERKFRSWKQSGYDEAREEGLLKKFEEKNPLSSNEASAVLKHFRDFEAWKQSNADNFPSQEEWAATIGEAGLRAKFDKWYPPVVQHEQQHRYVFGNFILLDDDSPKPAVLKIWKTNRASGGPYTDFTDIVNVEPRVEPVVIVCNDYVDVNGWTPEKCTGPCGSQTLIPGSESPFFVLDDGSGGDKAVQELLLSSSKKETTFELNDQTYVMHRPSEDSQEGAICFYQWPKADETRVRRVLAVPPSWNPPLHGEDPKLAEVRDKKQQKVLTPSKLLEIFSNAHPEVSVVRVEKGTGMIAFRT